MFPVPLVCSIGCLLPLALFFGAITPITVRAEYRRNQGFWPQAKWVAWLELCGMEGVCLLMVFASVALLLYTVGNPPLFSYDAGSELPDILLAAIGGPTLLAILAWAALLIVQVRRHGLPPQNPSS